MSLCQAREPVGDRAPDRFWRILLEKVDPAYGDFTLVRPSSTSPRSAPGSKSHQVHPDEQLGQRARGDPFRIGAHDGVHLGWLAVDRNLARPRQSRPTTFSRLGKWTVPAISSLSVRRSSRQRPLDEHVLPTRASHRRDETPRASAGLAGKSAQLGSHERFQIGVPLTASRCQFAQSKPSAEPQSCTTNVTRSRTPS